MTGIVSARPFLRYLPAILPPLVAFILYLPALPNDFAFDDVHLISQNPAVCGDFLDVGEIFASSYWGAVKKEDRSAYRPLTMLLHASLCQGFGPRPWAHRLLNIFLHAANAFLLFLLLRRLTAKPSFSCLFALFFATHPLNSEPVLFASFRPELFVTTCALLMVIISLKILTGKITVLHIILLFLLQSLAVFSKENAFVVPLLAALSVITLSRPWPLRRTAVIFAVPFAANIVYLCARYAVLGSLLSATPFPFLDNPVAQAATSVRVMTGLAVFARYLGLFFLPLGQAHDYSYAEVEPVTALSDPVFVMGAFVAGLCFLLVGMFYLRNPPAAFGLTWLLVALFPVSNVPFPIGTIMAERLCYLPFIGLYIVFSGLACRLRLRLPFLRLAQAAAFFALLAFSALSVHRGLGPRDNCAFFSRLVRDAPRSAKAHYGHGVCLLKSYDLGPALRSLDIAIRIYPDFEDAAIQLAQALERSGHAQEGIARLTAFVSGHPDAKSATFALAKMLARNNRYEEAAALLDELTAKYPTENIFRVFRERVRQSEQAGKKSDAGDKSDP